MRTVHKFQLYVTETVQTLKIPVGSIIRHVGRQDFICLWVEVDSDAAQVERSFRVFGTGQQIPDGFVYVGTAHDDPFVWHVYERRIA